MAGRNVARVAALVSALLLVFVAGLTGSAVAATPEIAITQPLGGTSTRVQAPVFTVTSTDTVDSVTLDIYAGANATGTPVQSPSVFVPVEFGPENATWDIVPEAPLAQGQYTAVAQQTNQELETGASTPVTFTIDTTPPAVTLTSPASGELLHVSRPKFSGRAGQASGDDQLVALKIYKGASASGSPTQELSLIPSKGEWTTGSNGPVLAKGIYTAVAEQADLAGNIEVSMTTFTIDTSSPEVTLDTAGLIPRGQQLLAGPTPSFSGTGATEPEDSSAVIVSVYSGTSTSGTALRTIEAALNGSAWKSEPVAALPDGTYTVQAEQTDSNPTVQIGVSESVTFTVDADAPPVTIGSPANGSSTVNASELVSGSAGNNEGDLPGVTVELYAGPAAAAQNAIEAITVQASGASWSAVFGGLTPGTYTVQAEQSDDVGNTGRSASVTFSVTAAPQATLLTQPPAASFKWIPATPNTDEPVTLISTATDAGAAITGFAWAPAGNGVFAAGESSLTTSFSTPGPHLVQLRVTDASGGSSLVAETIPVSAAPVPLMQPFPVVRMAGSYNASGAKISLLAVLAPVGAKVVVTCHGPHCPAKAQTLVAIAPSKSKAGTAVINFHRFEHQLRAGVVLEVSVSKYGEIGKFTRFAIHRGKSPSRIDECLNPAATAPIVCPS